MVNQLGCSKTNFHLYLRLAVIMGLTWVIGLAAGFVNLEPLWFAFVVLNALQGLFIFIAFTCTKKVLSSLRVRLTTTTVSFTDSSSKPARLHNNEVFWKWSKDNNTASTSAGSPNSTMAGNGSEKFGLDPEVPSRYGSRSKTMYTVSRYQANCATNQKSFDGRYF